MIQKKYSQWQHCLHCPDCNALHDISWGVESMCVRCGKRKLYMAIARKITVSLWKPFRILFFDDWEWSCWELKASRNTIHTFYGGKK